MATGGLLRMFLGAAVLRNSMRGWKDWTSLVVLGLVALATLVIGGISIWFNTDPPIFPYSANVLITTFAAGMTVLAIGAMTLTYRDGNKFAWYSLWAYPAFFVAHVVMLGTYIPDLVLAAVAAGALALGWPGKTPRASGSQQGQRAPAGTSVKAPLQRL